jgi:hypothetical protein
LPEQKESATPTSQTPSQPSIPNYRPQTEQQEFDQENEDLEIAQLVKGTSSTKA